MASRKLCSVASRLSSLSRLATASSSSSWLSRQMATIAPPCYRDVQQDDSGSTNPLFRRRRRRDRGLSPLGMFQDLWDPFLSSRNLKQMMDNVERAFEDLPRALDRDIVDEDISVRTPWDVTSDADAYYMRVDMPGLAKDDVKVSVEDGELIIKGEPSKKEEDGLAGRSYGNYFTRVSLPDDSAVEQVKAEMKNGVLKIVVPKVKEDTKTSIINVQVD